jgi:predicted nucleic acid-binding protein
VIVVADAGPLIYLSEGVLVEAKRRGHLALVGPVIALLVAAGFRVSDAVKEQVLRGAGE